MLKEGIYVFDDRHLEFDDDREPEDAWMQEDYVAPESNPDIVDTTGRTGCIFSIISSGKTNSIWLFLQKNFRICL